MCLQVMLISTDFLVRVLQTHTQHTHLPDRRALPSAGKEDGRGEEADVGASLDMRKDFITLDSYLPRPWASAPRAAARTLCNADARAVPRGFFVMGTAQCEHRLKISFNSFSGFTPTCLSWP